MRAKELKGEVKEIELGEGKLQLEENSDWGQVEENVWMEKGGMAVRVEQEISEIVMFVTWPFH